MAIHKPVLIKEVIESLDPQPNQNFIDCTLGAGGHTRELLEKTRPNGKVLALDWDENAVIEAKQTLKEYLPRLTLIRDNYSNLKKVVQENDFADFSGVLLDLGLSSDQLKSSGRGFSFLTDEPLDMRFSLTNGLTAGQILNNWSEPELKKILKEFGEEEKFHKIVAEIVKYRRNRKFKTTHQLVDLIERVKGLPRKGKIHPATKVFQALRIAVNNELENIKSTLAQAAGLMPVGSKIAVISFHSLEDRIIKQFFQRESKDCVCPSEIPECRCGHRAILKIITKKPVIASAAEVKENPRARSAKLRVAERI
ncbi:MAG: 16S rRNA (cytosine(1402)-N(4))-methyltransferase RsmH [Patescibacteria group bacterium]